MSILIGLFLTLTSMIQTDIEIHQEPTESVYKVAYAFDDRILVEHESSDYSTIYFNENTSTELVVFRYDNIKKIVTLGDFIYIRRMDKKIVWIDYKKK